MKTTVLVLIPGAKEVVAGECRGLGRGVYREFKMIHRTVYPFGLLNKFKLSDVKTRVSVLPGFNETFAKDLREDFRRRISGKDQEREFHSHRAYTLRDSMRFVDWKKSAGRPSNEWLLKEYESRVDDFGVLLDPDWQTLLGAVGEENYEQSLSVLRTACEVIHEAGRKVVLFSADHRFIVGYSAILQLLVEFPRFAERHQVKFSESNELASGNFVILRIDSNHRHAWGERSMYLRSA